MDLIQSTNSLNETKPNLPRQVAILYLWGQGLISTFPRISSLLIFPENFGLANLHKHGGQFYVFYIFIYVCICVSINIYTQCIYAHILLILFLWNALIYISVPMWWPKSQPTKSVCTRKAYLQFTGGKESNSFNQVQWVQIYVKVSLTPSHE